MGEFNYTFLRVFMIAEYLGIPAIKETFKKCHQKWKDDVSHYASIVYVLNHRLWYHYDHDNEQVARIYDSLWRKANNYAINHFKGKELRDIVRFLD